MNQLGALAGFVFVGSVTPGPNNTLLLASGLRFGLRRTLPHVIGTALGMGALLIAMASGIGALFEAVPHSETVLKIVGSGYLLYLAYRVATSSGVDRTDVSHPMNVLHAGAFQWVNPKAWIFAIVAVATFLPADTDRWHGVVLLTVTSMTVIVVASAIWAAGGAALRRTLDDERRRRPVNIALAILLVASVVSIW